MIYESYYWKDDLIKTAYRINRRRFRNRCDDRANANLEKDIMIGFYTIRKLIEARKVSDSNLNIDVEVSSFRATGRRITLLNRHHIDELYDQTSEQPEARKIIFICNQIIHSYIFTNETENSRLYSVLFASDRLCRTTLLRLTLKEIVKVFKIYGSDYPSAMDHRLNSDGSETIRLYN